MQPESSAGGRRVHNKTAGPNHGQAGQAHAGEQHRHAAATQAGWLASFHQGGCRTTSANAGQRLCKAKDFDTEAASKWLNPAFPNGKRLEHFPQRGPDSWSVRRSENERAIALAGSSAPGPDCILYAMWKQLGDLAVELLWQTAQELQSTI